MQFCTANGYIVHVDPEDYTRIVPYAWYGRKASNTVYVCTDTGGRTVRLHRFLLDAPRHLVVDHINGDGLDNRRCNIRLCTQSENLRNKKVLGRRNTTGCAGVYGYAGRYSVDINVDSQSYALGVVHTIEEAKILRRIGELFLWREFAPVQSRAPISDTTCFQLGFIVAALGAAETPGVRFNPRHKKWQSYHQGKHVGLYATKDEALAAKCAAEQGVFPTRATPDPINARVKAERAGRRAQREARKAADATKQREYTAWISEIENRPDTSFDDFVASL